MPYILPEVCLRQAFLYAINAALQLGMTHTFLEEYYQIDQTTSWRIRKGMPSDSPQVYMKKLVHALNDKKRHLQHLAEFKSEKHLQVDDATISRINQILANITLISYGLMPE